MLKVRRAPHLPHQRAPPPIRKKERPHQRSAAPQEAPTDFPHRAQRHHRARPTLTPREECNPRRRTLHEKLARNDISALQGLNAQPGLTVAVRVDTRPPPTRLQQIADQAAHSGNLRSMHPADLASHAAAPWDELRVWDPRETREGGGETRGRSHAAGFGGSRGHT